MRHRVSGRKLGRSGEHRLALLRNLSSALFEREKITTTLAKAKELRPFAERLVTLSKRETLHARRQVLRHIKDRKVVTKLFDSLSARFAQRPGGYTRIIKLGPRRGDHAEMAIVELLGADETLSSATDKTAAQASPKKARAPKKKKKKKKKTTKTAKAVGKQTAPSEEGAPAKKKKVATKRKAKAGKTTTAAATKATKKAASKKTTPKKKAQSKKKTGK